MNNEKLGVTSVDDTFYTKIEMNSPISKRGNDKQKTSSLWLVIYIVDGITVSPPTINTGFADY